MAVADQVRRAVMRRSCCTPCSPHVFQARHWFKVRRVDAARMLAEMVELHPLRNRPDMLLVRQPMRGPPFAAKANPPVSLFCSGTKPQPTTGDWVPFEALYFRGASQRPSAGRRLRRRRNTLDARLVAVDEAKRLALHGSTVPIAAR